MSLPKINAPIFELVLPSTEKTVKYRPFLVKEQKILLIAMESGDQRSMMTAIKQIINNCAVDPVEVDKLPVFDLEYFFVRLRAKSIGETIDLNLRHPNDMNSKDEVCEHVTKKTLNLLDVEVHKSIAHEDKIVLDEETKIGIKFKYPTSEFALSIENPEEMNQLDLATDAIINSIDFIFDADNVYKREDHTRQELIDFIENLSQKQYEKLSSFFDTMPKLKHEVTWKCTGCGQEEKVSLEGLANFFG
jgi:undecaprenyl pyrophosphate synthase